MILNFRWLLTLIIHDPWIIRVKRQRNFILTWISFCPTTYIFSLVFQGLLCGVTYHHIRPPGLNMQWPELVELASLCRKYTWNKWRINVTKYMITALPSNYLVHPVFYTLSKTFSLPFRKMDHHCPWYVKNIFILTSAKVTTTWEKQSFKSSNKIS